MPVSLIIAASPFLDVMPDSVTDPVRFFVLAIAAAMLFGAAKAGFGGGIAMASTPMMILACQDSPTATGLMLPLLIAADYITVIMWWRRWDEGNVRRLVPGMVAGVVVGWWLLWVFHRLDGLEARDLTNAALKLVIGLIAVGFVALHFARNARGDRRHYRPAGWHGSAFGAAAGVTSTLAHAAGPVTQMYLLPQGMTKDRYVATTVLFYWITNQVKLIPYASLSMITLNSLGTDLLLLPAVGVGAWLGVKLHHRINQIWFDRVVYTLLGVMGVYLVVTSMPAVLKTLGAQG